MEEHEIHDEDARTIVRLARETSSIAVVVASPEAIPLEPDGSFEESLMAVQTITGAFIFPFLMIAGIFGGLMSRD